LLLNEKIPIDVVQTHLDKVPFDAHRIKCIRGIIPFSDILKYEPAITIDEVKHPKLSTTLILTKYIHQLSEGALCELWSRHEVCIK
jgi:hypothetical protein